MIKAASTLLTVTAVLGLIHSILGAGLAYTRGFAPWWTAVAAALLGLTALTVRRRRRCGPLLWLAVVLLAWTSGGVVFDAFRAASVLGVPGMEPVVDWSGFALRAVAGGAAVLTAVVTLRDRPVGLVRSWPGFLAAAFAIPYPMLKLYWWAGGPWGRDVAGHAGAFPVGEVIAFALAAVWALALVMEWGAVLPRRLLVAGGGIAAFLLIDLGALAGLGMLADLVGVVDGPFEPSGRAGVVLLVYGSWLGLGICLAFASWDRHRSPDRHRSLHVPGVVHEQCDAQEDTEVEEQDAGRHGSADGR